MRNSFSFPYLLIWLYKDFSCRMVPGTRLVFFQDGSSWETYQPRQWFCQRLQTFLISGDFQGKDFTAEDLEGEPRIGQRTSYGHDSHVGRVLSRAPTIGRHYDTSLHCCTKGSTMWADWILWCTRGCLLSGTLSEVSLHRRSGGRQNHHC
jgi:hypothetical protein